MEPLQEKIVTPKNGRKLRSQSLATPEGNQALTAEKEILKDRGWTYRTAAPVLDVSYPYLSNVLNGRMKSRRLLEKIRKIRVKEDASKTKRRRKASVVARDLNPN